MKKVFTFALYYSSISPIATYGNTSFQTLCNLKSPIGLALFSGSIEKSSHAIFQTIGFKAQRSERETTKNRLFQIMPHVDSNTD